MPEGPEIKRAANKLETAIKDKTVTRVYFAFAHLQGFSQKLQGAKILRVHACSKAILSQFDNGLTIYSHNQLYGRWQIFPAGEYPQSSRSLRLAIHTQEKMALLYSASEIEVIKTSQLSQHPYLKKLGPELLADTVNSDEIIARFHNQRFHHRQLMGLLQDQQFISGMGNYLCCEALYVSRLHPCTRLADLSKPEREKLAKNCLKLSWKSYKTGGITNKISRTEELRKQGLSFENYRFHIYRREGQPCYHCATKITKDKYGGKMGFICPDCQPICLR